MGEGHAEDATHAVADLESGGEASANANGVRCETCCRCGYGRAHGVELGEAAVTAGVAGLVHSANPKGAENTHRGLRFLEAEALHIASCRQLRTVNGNLSGLN